MSNGSAGGTLIDKLKDLLVRHEGLRLKPYLCPAGKLTIGVGRNLEDVGITEREAHYMLAGDIVRCVGQAQAFPWYEGLTAARRDVVICMIFNLGLAGFKGFKNMHAAMAGGNYLQASREMLNSKWATQVGNRAIELAEMMRTGHYPV